jgi:hypothetical protein
MFEVGKGTAILFLLQVLCNNSGVGTNWVGYIFLSTFPQNLNHQIWLSRYFYI